MTVLVIAEAGVNHNGDLDLALRLIDAAAEAGADVVKFQTFRAERVASPQARKALYQEKSTGADESQLDMIRRLELSADAHRRIQARCRERRIRFLSTPFDVPSVTFLTADLNVDTLKIGSGNIDDAPLLVAAGRTRRPVILSTGMATLAEVEAALGILAFGYTTPANEPPSRARFASAFTSAAGKVAIKEKITLLHCTTEYPAPVAEANLRAMETLRRTFDLPVGLSDHTPGIAVATAAVALGATVIEKHLTLDRSLPGPDHAASLEPVDFAELVAAIRAVEAALGDGDKRPMPSEIKNKAIARKSLVARRAIAKGELFSAENLDTLRPGNGIPAIEYFDWIGRPAARSYASGELVDSAEG